MRLIALLAILVASPGWAGLVSRPTKTCGTTTYVAEVAAGCTTIKSSEVDADFFAIITGGVNNIETANINVAGLGTAAYANASVTAAKLAPNAVTAANIADGSITSAKIADDTIVNADVNSAAAILGTKLAVGAAVNAFGTGGGIANLPIAFADGEVTVASQAITTRGGRVMTFGSLSIAGSSTVSGTVTIRFRRDATLVSTSIFDINGATNSILLPMFTFTDQPAAGSYTYTYTVQSNTIGVTFATHPTTPGVFSALELS